MIGKMAGGWLAKRVGIVGALAIALVTVAVCFIGKNYNVAIFLAGLFAINLTMPVTLYLANVALKGREGLAFGWLAAALIPGYSHHTDRNGSTIVVGREKEEGSSCIGHYKYTDQYTAQPLSPVCRKRLEHIAHR